MRSLNIAGEDELTFHAFMILLCIYMNDIIDPAGIHHYTKIDMEVINKVMNNFTQQGVVKDGILYINTEEENFYLELLLVAMVGAGMLERRDADESTEENHLRAVI